MVSLEKLKKEVTTVKYIVLVGRILFSLIFVIGGISNFSKQAIEHGAAQGIPLAAIAVPLSGVIALLGGLSIALGYKAKWGAWLLVLFLVPVTVMTHNFWAIQDSMLAQMHQVMFMKNLSMLGAALLISYFGAGPLSLDGRQKTHSEQRTRRLQHREAVIA
ncbi:DoxX family protein [candidate division KSB1 bacterium]|nr:MAG: DoxX family protein [candidate division KSB1 bacterium]MBC6947430.1 DoxX family protein [candidate division KSB1 bacterium]MCE7945196.1 DoxX family protein [Chlorobi bacterium CHB1]MDL1874220.1 DoxX family protein [Cytophagia bacterium CHB2]